MKIECKLEDFITADELIKKAGTGLYGTVQKYIDSAVIRYCNDYLPFDTGTLERSANTATKIGSGSVVYDTPYAHYMYYGEIYGPNIPMKVDGEETFRSPAGIKKTPTGRTMEYNREVHPLAGSRWFDRAMADHAQDIAEGANTICRLLMH